MFRWFRKRVQRPQPEAKWLVAIKPAHICVTDDQGCTQSVAKSDLTAVAIETNDTGPWGADVWWLLFGAEDQLACVFPQGATGESAALDYLGTLDGIDQEQIAKAMCSTNNTVFSVWRAPGC